jgi:DisA bacterial checkpoint controller nucleotide-binding
MPGPAPPPTGRLRRLTEELADEGFALDVSSPVNAVVLDELDYALRPTVHERRVPSFGAIVAPSTDPSGWHAGTDLVVTRRSMAGIPTPDARRFADGLSSWVMLHAEATPELAVFDRPAGSERDLVVLADVLGATIVQRHPSGLVRLAGDFGIMRWDGRSWHREPPVDGWIDAVSACRVHGDRAVLARLLSFAVHDLGARGIGALLIYRPVEGNPANYEARLRVPPPLRIDRPADLAPLRHVLGQIDGAAVFDAAGTLRELGVRLVPSAEAESDVDGLRGMRHTSARRYSFDDAHATLIVVSEDGPVTVLRNGEILGRSEEP